MKNINSEGFICENCNIIELSPSITSSNGMKCPYCGNKLIKVNLSIDYNEIIYPDCDDITTHAIDDCSECYRYEICKESIEKGMEY